LVAFIDTFHDVLYSLRAKLRPPGVFWKTLQSSYVSLQAVVGKMFLVPPVVSPMQSNAVIVNNAANMNLTVESFVTLYFV
jgi:hypothetical protein